MTWTIVGLGNPGEEYEHTRHNTGRMLLAYVAKKYDCTDWQENKKTRATLSRGNIGKETLLLLAPDTFMNKSGIAVSAYVKSAKAAQRLVVVYDDLDLPLGKMKISFDRGSGGHKGLESIIRAIKTKAFARIRIGVSPATPSGKTKKPSGEQEVIDFILKEFKEAEMKELKKVFKKAAEAVEVIVTQGLDRAMNEYN